MNKIILMTGMSAGGWAGWWLGSPVGFMAAFVLSVLGTAAGIVVARRLIGSISA